MQKIGFRAAAALAIVVYLGMSLAGNRHLTFDDRVLAQTAIEQVYWSHRIWPVENPGAKPPFSVVMPDAAIRAKVEDYLKKSSTLAEIGKRPITAEQLQAELDRMTAHTRDPQVLREIFTALGNDPFVIAETLARQTLADRLIRSWYAFDDRFHGELRTKAQAALAACNNAGCMRSMGGIYGETTWELRGKTDEPVAGELATSVVSLDAEEWKQQRARLATKVGGTAEVLPLMTLSRLEETADAFVVTAVLSQDEREIKAASTVWKKLPFDAWWATGRASHEARLNASPGEFTLHTPVFAGCTPDTWTATAAGAPAARREHTAVWTGSEMIVWGGSDGTSSLNTGGRYTPATDSWAATSTGTNVPPPGRGHSAVWTGTEMIIWGGRSGFAYWNQGGRYNPSTDTWVATSTGSDVPAGRYVHSTVWTGTEMIVWGGYAGGSDYENTGGRYFPATDTWAATPTGVEVPAARCYHTAVWTGTEMIVWGGNLATRECLNTGGRYNPSSNTWAATSTGANTPPARTRHVAVWTSSQMIVWGGATGSTSYTNTGGRYSPGSDTWTATSTGASLPAERHNTTAVWTGSEMIVWGGASEGGSMNTGGRYAPGSDTWTTTSTGINVPAVRYAHTAVWTGTEMIVWGGEPVTDTGGRYCAADCASPAIWYQDQDGDGYGISSVTVRACAQPPGYAASAGDCNDANAQIHPGMSEICDGNDNDCDGDTDEGGGALCDDGNACTSDSCDPAIGCVQTPVNCNDGNVCTSDSCDPVGGCTFLPVDGNPCDDGVYDTCGDTCSNGLCFGHNVAQPEDVGDDAVGFAGDKQTVVWSDVPGTYNVYRGSNGHGASPWEYDQTCLAANVTGNAVSDTDVPPAGTFFYYLVSRVNECRESNLGHRSNGAPTPNEHPCAAGG